MPPFNSSIILPTGAPYNGEWFTRDLNADGIIDSTVLDGSLITLRFPDAGSNISPANQQFLGGVGGIVESANLDAVFNTFMPAGWGMPGGHGTVVSSVRTLNGSKALLNSREGGKYQFGIRYDAGAARRIGFARYSYYFDNPNNSEGQLKQHRMCGSLVSGGGISDADIANCYLTHSFYNGHQISVNTYDGVNGGNTVIYTGEFDAGSFGGWHEQGVWVTVEVSTMDNTDTVSANGRMRIFARREDTGAVIGDITVSNELLRDNGEALVRYFVLQMYMGNGYDTSCKVYIDRDYYLSYSDTATHPKFILLANSATFTPTDKKTICKFDSWTPVENGAADVAFYVNKGAHASLSGLYAYAMADINQPINTSGIALL